MSDFQKIKNEFYFKSKESGRNEFLELTKASQINCEMKSFEFGYSDLEVVINVDRIIYMRFKDIINEYHEFSKSFFLSNMDEKSGISSVYIIPIYEDFVDWDALRGSETKDSLIEKVKYEKNIFMSLVGLSTEIPEEEYISLHQHIVDCMKKAGVSYPNICRNYMEIIRQLKAVATDKGSYELRRKFIDELYKNVTITLEKSIDESSQVGNDYTPTGWASIDQDINLVLAMFRNANSIIEYNGIANMLRKLMKDLASIVYIDEIHRPISTLEPIPASMYKNRLTAYVIKCFPTETNDEYRNLAKKTADVADKVSHSVDSKYKLELAIESTIFLIKIIKIAHINIKFES